MINKAVDNEICVYGVEVPGVEGKAGMACIVDAEKKVQNYTLHTGAGAGAAVTSI